MNKYQYRAVLTAFLALSASFALWTSALDHLKVPRFADSTVRLVDTIITELVGDIFQTQEVTVQEVTVESLGKHFSAEVQQLNVRASVTTDTDYQQAPKPVVIDPVLEAEPEPEAVHAAPPSELEQWGLIRAWSIAVPSLSIRAPVLLPSMQYWSTQAWDLLEEQMQVGLNHGTVAYPHSVNPGQNGTLIIAGHSSPPDARAEHSSYGSVFAKLPEIEIGEEIQIQSVSYVVESKKIVSPAETSILQQQGDDSLVKLITCYPVGTTRDRMVITARKISQ